MKGGGLGFSGIPGIAVAFVTYQSVGAPSANFVGITDGPTATAPDAMHWLATSTAIPSLRATRHVKIEVLNGTITVWIEGTQVLSQAVTVPAQALLGFSGGSGGSTDNHQVSNVTIGGDAAPTSQSGDAEAHQRGQRTDWLTAGDRADGHRWFLPGELHDARARQWWLRHTFAADCSRGQPVQRR